ncbi:hypothetical protein VTJ04DRAFT_3449 [Mycothermus thermophilus]|uniref:uncharacterized protein n=1 Tax=Humicola insolens TaxID=85995 RepID=UPI003743AD53
MQCRHPSIAIALITSLAVTAGATSSSAAATRVTPRVRHPEALPSLWPVQVPVLPAQDVLFRGLQERQHDTVQLLPLQCMATTAPPPSPTQTVGTGGSAPRLGSSMEMGGVIVAVVAVALANAA